VDVSVLQVAHFYADGDEQYTITVTAVKEQIIQGDDLSGILEGFSVDYWKNNLSSWIGLSPTINLNVCSAFIPTGLLEHFLMRLIQLTILMIGMVTELRLCNVERLRRC
jgi:hypothetical protein